MSQCTVFSTADEELLSGVRTDQHNTSARG